MDVFTPFDPATSSSSQFTSSSSVPPYVSSASRSDPFRPNIPESKARCDLDTGMDLVKGITSKFAKFRILDTCMSHTFNDFTMKELVDVWEEEKKVLSVIDMAARAKNFKEKVDTATFFYYHTIFYLHFGKFGWVHSDLEPLQSTCPYTDGANNFMTMLARTKVCLCQCYTEYVLAAAGEFGYKNITSVLQPQHAFPAVVSDKEIHFAMDEGFRDNAKGIIVYYETPGFEGYDTFATKFDAPNIEKTTVKQAAIKPFKIITPYRWGIFIHVFYALINRKDVQEFKNVENWSDMSKILSATKDFYGQVFSDVKRGRLTWEVVSKIFPGEYMAVRKLIQEIASNKSCKIDFIDLCVPLKELMEAEGNDDVFKNIASLVIETMISFDFQYELGNTPPINYGSDFFQRLNNSP